jgi:hypothetical protein
VLGDCRAHGNGNSRKVNGKINCKVNGVGQECPTHTSNCNIKSHCNGKINCRSTASHKAG